MKNQYGDWLVPGSIFPSSSAWSFPAAAAIDILCELITSRAVSFFFIPALINPWLFLPSPTTLFSIVFTPSSWVSIAQSGFWATPPVIGVRFLHSQDKIYSLSYSVPSVCVCVTSAFGLCGNLVTCGPGGCMTSEASFNTALAILSCSLASVSILSCALQQSSDALVAF